MTTKERIHRLVDALPDAELPTALRVIEALALAAGAAGAAGADAPWAALDAAPDDDEPVTDEERAAAAEGWADYRSGRVVPLEEIERELRERSA